MSTQDEIGENGETKNETYEAFETQFRLCKKFLVELEKSVDKVVEVEDEVQITAVARKMHRLELRIDNLEVAWEDIETDVRKKVPITWSESQSMKVEAVRDCFDTLRGQMDALTKDQKSEEEVKHQYDKPRCKIEALKLPIFHGETIEYKAWKKVFSLY